MNLLFILINPARHLLLKQRKNHLIKLQSMNFISLLFFLSILNGPLEAKYSALAPPHDTFRA